MNSKNNTKFLLYKLDLDLVKNICIIKTQVINGKHEYKIMYVHNQVVARIECAKMGKNMNLFSFSILICFICILITFHNTIKKKHIYNQCIS